MQHQPVRDERDFVWGQVSGNSNNTVSCSGSLIIRQAPQGEGAHIYKWKEVQPSSKTAKTEAKGKACGWRKSTSIGGSSQALAWT
eukprot:2466725-Amphidinium_carterae.1